MQCARTCCNMCIDQNICLVPLIKHLVHKDCKAADAPYMSSNLVVHTHLRNSTLVTCKWLEQPVDMQAPQT